MFYFLFCLFEYTPALHLLSSGVQHRFYRLFLWNVVDNQSQAGSSPQREWRPRRLIDKRNAFCLTIFQTFFASTGSLNLEVCWFICLWLLKFTHTFLYYTQNTNTSCIWSLCAFFVPSWGCQPWGNDALTNKSVTSMNVGMQHIAIKAPFEMQHVAAPCWFITDTADLS